MDTPKPMEFDLKPLPKVPPIICRSFSTDKACENMPKGFVIDKDTKERWGIGVTIFPLNINLDKGTCSLTSGESHIALSANRSFKNGYKLGIGKTKSNEAAGNLFSSISWQNNVATDLAVGLKGTLIRCGDRKDWGENLNLTVAAIAEFSMPDFPNKSFVLSVSNEETSFTFNHFFEK